MTIFSSPQLTMVLGFQDCSPRSSRCHLSTEPFHLHLVARSRVLLREFLPVGGTTSEHSPARPSFRQVGCTATRPIMSRRHGGKSTIPSATLSATLVRRIGHLQSLSLYAYLENYTSHETDHLDGFISELTHLAFPTVDNFTCQVRPAWGHDKGLQAAATTVQKKLEDVFSGRWSDIKSVPLADPPPRKVSEYDLPPVVKRGPSLGRLKSATRTEWWVETHTHSDDSTIRHHLIAGPTWSSILDTYSARREEYFIGSAERNCRLASPLDSPM
jgi:hypothetical protein